MKILYISPTYHPRIGGVEYVVKSVAERLAKAGHEVSVLAGESGIDEPVEKEVNGVRVVRWPTWALGRAYHVPRQRSRLESILRELLKGVDVVHIHSIHAVLPVGLDLRIKGMGFAERVMIALRFHGSRLCCLKGFFGIPWKVCLRRLLSVVDAIHLVSRYEAKLVRESF